MTRSSGACRVPARPDRAAQTALRSLVGSRGVASFRGGSGWSRWQVRYHSRLRPCRRPRSDLHCQRGARTSVLSDVHGQRQTSWNRTRRVHLRRPSLPSPVAVNLASVARPGTSMSAAWCRDGPSGLLQSPRQRIGNTCRILRVASRPPDAGRISLGSHPRSAHDARRHP
jgi:hypothetical protein